MRPIRLAIDLNGGDHGSNTLLQGAIDAIQSYDKSLVIYLCGEEREIRNYLSSKKELHLLEKGLFVIEDSPQRIEESDSPLNIWKTKKNSSIIKCLTLQKEEIVDASLSAGDTRVLMSGSIFILGRNKGVTRPALAAFLPTTASHPCLLLDVGANIDCKSGQLVSFGLMGFEYAKRFFGQEVPSVHLLNVGHESTKGTRVVREADAELASCCKGYKGFVEGSQILSGIANVIVCDGFLGNTLLKACESFHPLIVSVLSGETELLSALKRKMAILNPDNYGAAPLLGLNGIVFKAHGSSSSHAITHALLMTTRAIEQRIIARSS